jgi:hypothetical protein
MMMASHQAWIDAPVTNNILHKKMKEEQNKDSDESHFSLVKNNKTYILCGGANIVLL